MNHHQSKKTIKLLKNTLYTNFKAEIFTSFLLEQGIQEQNIRIVRLGKALQKVKKEVQELRYQQTQNEAYYGVYTHRRDLYDSLPKGLFHTHITYLTDKKRLKSQLLKRIELAREEEKNARLFFKPFEFFIDRALMATQWYERRLEKPLSHPDFVHLFCENWAFLKEMPLDKALFIINFLSQSYRITSGEQIAQIVSFFLECDVTIKTSFQKQTIKTAYQWALGEQALGESSFVGGDFSDTLPIIEVVISQLPLQYMELIYQDSPIRKQFSSLLDLFIPADAHLSLLIKGKEEDTAFSLSVQRDTILGFSTRLQ